MYDPETAALIRSAPELPELDRERLPDFLSQALAKIVSARVTLREGNEDPNVVLEIIKFARKLALANEALVALDPDRENRAAAGFVAATAYQLIFQANSLLKKGKSIAFLKPDGISPDVSAMLLFLVAEASADATEVARTIRRPRDTLQSELILNLTMLAQGKVGRIVARRRLQKRSVVMEMGVERANAALYYRLLEGVRALAFTLQGRRARRSENPIQVFVEVKDLAAPIRVRDLEDLEEFKGSKGLENSALTVFPGPFHLACLLIAAGAALLDGAVINLPPPVGVSQNRWRKSMQSLAKTRPYLWRNHKVAIKLGYLDKGTSSAIGFPTGAGKSTTAQLKIRAVLLSGRRAVFLAPTHALVDQTARDLRNAFAKVNVKGERVEEFGFQINEEKLPDIFVMTPEACLLLCHMDSDRFEDVGLMIFDECHLIHPKTDDDRRAIDAMLCILSFVRVAPEADIVLLSAMMKNTDELSDWLAELTGRKALALDDSWKPTRQLRGCIVYDNDRLRELKKELGVARLKKPTGGAPAAVRREMTALPSAFFSVKQTWESKKRADYVLVPFFADELPLAVSAQWRLTPNSGEIAASIASAAAMAGIQSLVFSQSIPNAVSIAEKAAGKLDEIELELNDDERRAYDIAVDELGGADQLYLTLKDGKLRAGSGSHHGQLLREERYLVESLFKRRNALSVLAATPTLGQGMNLPAELVIIAEDSQYNSKSGRRDILSPEDLLNAAGRAGRAGESATGIVLVIPGKVVGFDNAENRIGNRWQSLRNIFGQSDQCLILDDPLTALMDRVHHQSTMVGDLERYVVARLAETNEVDGESRQLGVDLSRSFAAFRMRRAGQEDWVSSRTASALSLLNQGGEDDAVEVRPLRDLASMLGMPEEVLQRLAYDVVETELTNNKSVAEWRDWIFEWLLSHPADMFRLLNIENMEYLFGQGFKDLNDDSARAEFAVPKLRAALIRWMDGAPLAEIQLELSNKTRDLRRSTSARKFVIRVVPDLAHLLSTPLQILFRLVNESQEEPVDLSPALMHSNRCVRMGYSGAEMATYAVQNLGAGWSRREVHRKFREIEPYLAAAPQNETMAALAKRVETAVNEEQENHDWSDFI